MTEQPDFDDEDRRIADAVWDSLSADTVRTLTPARAGKSGRVNFDERAIRTFAAGLARHLMARFGLTYKDKPDA